MVPRQSSVTRGRVGDFRVTIVTITTTVASITTITFIVAIIVTITFTLTITIIEISMWEGCTGGQTASASKQRRPNPTLSSVSSCALQRLRAAQHFPQIRVSGFRVLSSRDLGF